MAKYALYVVLAVSVTACAPVMAYRRMQQYDNLQTDHDALTSCLAVEGKDCSRQQALYDADATAAGSMTRGNSRVTAIANGQ